MKTTLLGLAALTLTGCGQGGSRVDYHADGGQTVTIADPKNGNLTARIGAGATMPTDLPSWAAAYPGSTVMMSQKHGDAAGQSAMENVMLQTPDVVSKVSAFYDRKIAEAGVKPMRAVQDAEASTRMVETPSGIVGIAVTKNDDGGSSISITRLPKE